ncbi:MAG: alpha/beta fold hydrolase [Alphaproteobacteria bacterium]|nr:alpha/beta fold hydrolase [Alphaproteobacteria bacterium]
MSDGDQTRGEHTDGQRPGPRPLPLYLTTAATTWLSSYASSAAWRNGSLTWKPGSSEAAASLKNQLDALEAALKQPNVGKPSDNPSPAAFDTALDQEVRRRFGAFLGGIEAYRAHPYRRVVDEPPVCWKEGSTRLLDYGPLRDGGTEGRPILVVPSLVNRGYVLDLSNDRSLMRWLVERGFRPFLVEWGFPGEAERRFTLTDYIAGRLESALEAVLAITGRAPAVMGYCMGGLLALALAERRPRDTGALALLATPWDFAADAPPVAAALPMVEPWLAATIDATGWLPTDMIQTLFFSLDPMLVIRKFLSFAELAPDSDNALEFVALEDWLNDGVPLAAPVARETLFDWYGRNTPAAGTWRVAGRPVTPERVTTPTLAMIPARDRIVPPASARALADRMPNAVRADVALGHIGMAVSAGAKRRAWTTLADWLDETWQEKPA